MITTSLYFPSDDKHSFNDPCGKDYGFSCTNMCIFSIFFPAICSKTDQKLISFFLHTCVPFILMSSSSFMHFFREEIELIFFYRWATLLHCCDIGTFPCWYNLLKNLNKVTPKSEILENKKFQSDIKMSHKKLHLKSQFFQALLRNTYYLLHYTRTKHRGWKGDQPEPFITYSTSIIHVTIPMHIYSSISIYSNRGT